MTLLTSYSSGTVTVGASSTTVTGSGTAWSTAGVEAGDYFWAAGLSVRIASVNGNTSLTLAYAWPGAALLSANYEVQFTPDATRNLASTRSVLEQLTNGNISALGDLTTAADRLAYYTGAGTAALTGLTSAARSLLDDTSVSAMRETLGLGPLVTLSTVPIENGGTGATTTSAARTNLGLGTVAVKNTGTSGDAVPLLNASNTWSSPQLLPNGSSSAPSLAFSGQTGTGWYRIEGTGIGAAVAGVGVLSISGNNGISLGTVTGGNNAVTGTIASRSTTNGDTNVAPAFRSQVASDTNVVFRGVESVGSAWVAQLLVTAPGASADYRFNMSGSAYALNGSWISSSDEHLKTLDDAWSDPISILRGLRGREYTRKDTGVRAIGLIAQDVEAVLPDQVKRMEASVTLPDGTVVDAPLAIDTGAIGAAVCVEVLKLVLDRLESAEAKIAALEAAQA